MNILHLSDLHFFETRVSDGNGARRGQEELIADARKSYTDLEADLRSKDLEVEKLDALVISGDVTDRSQPGEYEAATSFIRRVADRYGLESRQIIIVPGNHDVNWASTRQDKFNNFSYFYDQNIGEQYPKQADRQYRIWHFPEYDTLFLGLNSAWKLYRPDDEENRKITINDNALANALGQISQNLSYQECRHKIAVWHHPIFSSEFDHLEDYGFMERIAVEGFRLCLHGHQHKMGRYLYGYNQYANINVNIVSAGTFGARPEHLNRAVPWQYNLLKLRDEKITVYTRKREINTGPWSADPRWKNESNGSYRASYVIHLNPTPPVSREECRIHIQGLLRQQENLNLCKEAHNDLQKLTIRLTELLSLTSLDRLLVVSSTDLAESARSTIFKLFDVDSPDPFAWPSIQQESLKFLQDYESLNSPNFIIQSYHSRLQSKCASVNTVVSAWRNNRSINDQSIAECIKRLVDVQTTMNEILGSLDLMLQSKVEGFEKSLETLRDVLSP